MTIKVKVHDGDDATARPVSEAIAGALAAAVAGTGFRTRVKVKATAGIDPGPAKPDDLTRIRGITREQAAVLAAEGYASFAAIADWRRVDVMNMRRHLRLKREISKQNWIEQAALLAARSPWPSPPLASIWDRSAPAVVVAPLLTAVAVRLPQGLPLPVTPAHVLTPGRTSERVAPPERATPAVPRAALDRLDLIRGMCPAAEALLMAGGVRTASDVARWTAADVTSWGLRLGAGKRLSAEGWVEQAALLARGEPTHYARTSGQYPEIERIASPGPAQGTSSVVAPLIAKLAAVRLALAMARPLEPVPMFEATPRSGPASVHATASRSVTEGVGLDPESRRTQRPSPVAATEPRRPLPRYVEFVRAPYFDLPPLPLTPLADIRAEPLKAQTSRARTSPLDPVSEAIGAAVLPAATTEARSDPLMAAASPKSPERAERSRPSSLVPRRARAEPPRAVLTPTKRLTERIAELDADAPRRTAEPSEPLIAALREADAPLDLAWLETLDEDLPVLATQEAEVVIVSSPAPSPVLDSPPSPPRALTARELRRQGVTAPPPADVQSYAAYRDRVEEASVEIVRGSAPRPRAWPTAGQPTTVEPGKLDRFLTALGVEPADRTRQ